MKPCDCKSEDDAKKLDAQGMAINEWSMSIKPSVVVIENTYFGMVKIPMKLFKIFARWYLSEQKLENDE